MVSVVIKVLLASVALSCAIKYGGPLLGVPATGAAALAIVLAPAATVAAVLAWRSQRGATATRGGR